MRVRIHIKTLAVVFSLVVLLLAAGSARVHADSFVRQIPPPQPSPGAFGLEASKIVPPPTTTATISVPGNGSNVTSTDPITVSGLCTNGLLVQVYDSGVLVGAVDCNNGSFSIKTTLFPGDNDIYTVQYDDLAQASPTGNHITVHYNNANFAEFGTYITLTSNFGRRAADPGQQLVWPLQLSGGVGPYAFSIDWGDGKPAALQSQELAGDVNVSHVYSQSGIYHVTIKVTDKNGASAFMQVVAVANGKPTAGTTTSSGGTSTNSASATVVTKVLWWPAVVCIVLLLPAFWLGRRSEVVSMHHKLARDMENYKEY